ncbi:MAG: hypothetical protein QW816_01720 [Desulfurococcaceae archaeon]
MQGWNYHLVSMTMLHVNSLPPVKGETPGLRYSVEELEDQQKHRVIKYRVSMKPGHLEVITNRLKHAGMKNIHWQFTKCL